MSTNKYLSLDGLANYDALIKAEVAKGDSEVASRAESYTNKKFSDMVGSSTVSTQITSHNTSASAHSDIRELITSLTTKLNNFLDVDDTTSDQLSEVLTLIENNKGTLESLTTSKINVSDIIDNLTTSNASKVLSAKQGVVIKSLIDTLQAELDSHTHTISDVSGLQSALDSKAASSHNHSAANITSGTISAARLPSASGSAAGITLVYPAASCTTFSSDSGTVTPLAVQKGAKMFAITRPSATTNKAIVRYSNTTGDVQDSKIIIEDVTNTRDTSKKANVLSIPAEGNKKMVYGYCTDQVDGTSFIGGVFDADATEYPYSAGLAIGGTSGNLLWKGTKVATTADIPTIPSSLKNPNSLTVKGNGTQSFTYDGSSAKTLNIKAGTNVSVSSDTSGNITISATDTNTTYTSLKNPYSLTIQGNGTTLTNGTYDGSAAKTVNITASAIGAAAANHNHANQSINPQTLELGSGATNHGGYVDFHFNGTTDDYTSRIIESSSGTIELQKANLLVPNGKGIKGKDSAGAEQYLMFLSSSNTLQFGYNMPTTYLAKFNIPILLTSQHYGTSLPTAGNKGRIFLKKV